LDGNGYLDSNELKIVLTGMLDMLGADKKSHNVPALVAQITKDLDSSHDGKVSKDEFVKGLMAQPALRALMNPFN
jgi:Ca2+-binding EF-hand superfamily protein